ncbi:MAG: CHASE2 domain-containing protein, partial [Candidatus Neomarinimicrobiota bacterium]
MNLKKLISSYGAGLSWAGVSALAGKLKQPIRTGLAWANDTVPVRYLKKLLGAGRVWVAVSVIATLGIHSMGLFDLLNYKVLDFSYTNVRGPLAGWSARQPIDRDSLKVVLVEVDDESWRLVPFKWPYPRDEVWSRTIRNLTDAGARVIVFDIEFDTPDFKSDYLERLNQAGSNIPFRHGDEVLAEAIEYAHSKGTRVVLGAQMISETTRVPPQYIQQPVERLMAVDPVLGLVNTIEDFDQTYRKYALAFGMAHVQDTSYLPLAIKAVKEYRGIPDTTLLRPTGKPFEVGYGSAIIRTYGGTPSFIVNFYGPASGAPSPRQDGKAWKTFDRYPLSNVLDDESFDLREEDDDNDWMSMFDPDGEFNLMMQMLDPTYEPPESPFKDKIVLIGVSVNVLLDVKNTPYYNYAGQQQLMPGVEVHA